MMEDTETDRSSKRANLIEQRIFEITITSIDSLKHSTAIEIHKSQNEMKKRLRRYRDRQREIVKAKPGGNENSIEEMITRQMKNKAKARQQTRPKTSLGTARSRISTETELDLYSDSDSDIEIDGSFMIDQQKSKIDLRPKTAMDILSGRRHTSMETYVTSGRLGPAVKQIRYFDEDELKDRGQFYKYLVEKRITEEKNRLNSLDDKVAQFCGSDTIQTLARKMQSKRKFFAKNPEWAENVRAKTAHGTRKPVNRITSKQNTDRTLVLRPSTSLGTVRNSPVNIKSFKTPSYIATAR